MTEVTENCPECSGTLAIIAVAWDGTVEQMCTDCHEVFTEEREL